MKGIISGTGIARLAGCLPLLLTLSVGAAGNTSDEKEKEVKLKFDGTLLEHPCKLDPATKNLEVRFLERAAKYFHRAPGRGPAENFSIRLINCRTDTVKKTVKIRFSTKTTEEAMKEQSGYFLKVTGINAGKLAIGILDTDGTTLMKLGNNDYSGAAHNQGKGSPVDSNTLQFNFKAYVQATPDALAQKSVVPGSYESVVDFKLFYE